MAEVECLEIRSISRYGSRVISNQGQNLKEHLKILNS